MTIPVWTGGLIASLFFAYLGALARRWWPLAYLVCIFFAAGTGLLLGVGGSSFAGVWWFLFVAYILGFPIFRMVRDRLELRRAKEHGRKTEDSLMLELDRGDRARRDSW